MLKIKLVRLFGLSQICFVFLVKEVFLRLMKGDHGRYFLFFYFLIEKEKSRFLRLLVIIIVDNVMIWSQGSLSAMMVMGCKSG